MSNYNDERGYVTPPRPIHRAPGSTDVITRKIEEAFKIVCEAESLLAHADKGPGYQELLEAHGALLRAKNRRRNAPYVNQKKEP